MLIKKNCFQNKCLFKQPKNILCEAIKKKSKKYNKIKKKDNNQTILNDNIFVKKMDLTSSVILYNDIAKIFNELLDILLDNIIDDSIHAKYLDTKNNIFYPNQQTLTFITLISEKINIMVDFINDINEII
jgi:hypothetical protein